MSVHLHVRSCYTLLQSTLTIPKIVAAAKRCGYTAVALTDKHVMHGAMAFYHACKKEDIKPIFGMEVDVLEQEELYGFVVLAKNDAGYQNLLKLSTWLNTGEERRVPDLDTLAYYAKDCIVLTNGDQNQMETLIVKEELDLLRHWLKLCRKQFADFYVSIARNDSGLMEKKNPVLKQLCEELDIPCTALSRVYFEREEDEESYKTLCAINQGVSLHDKMLNYSPRRYFRSPQEMQELYEEAELQMSDRIAAQCQVEMQLPKAVLPKFQNKYGVSSEEFLRSLCQKGLQKRMQYQPISSVYQQRLDYELDVIIRMQYADYFLIVWDFIRFAKTQHIYIGPGRGSAAGSLVAYCLGITHVDPIRYHLLFERFLNPERISMPDIDTDFPDNRRDEVIHYVEQLYGKHRVSHIITFNTLAAKQVLRDVGKAMEINPRQIDRLCKLVPNVIKVTLDYAYQNDARFKELINSGETMRRLYATARKLEGLPRHASLHAAGIVFSDEAIEQVCPLIDVDEGVCATQFTMEYLEELGLIKMDFLGLRNLTIIDEIVQHINATADKQLDIMRIPLDDAKTYALIRAVDTVGVFQLESEGMKNLIRKMQPDRREHPEKVDYIHPSLQPILQNTYGIMIYQEQIMQVAQTMAGFTLGKADNLRKAISKKKGKELRRMQEEFIQGALHKGYDEALAQKVYALIMKFANYGFNRSHSVAYGMIAYQLAYLKANAPLYFFNSLLNSVIGSETKTSEYVFEARKRHIKILLPDVNRSYNQYGIEDNALRFPFVGIKGIGSAVSSLIVEERNKKGEFRDFFDFTARMNGNKIGRKTIEILINAGALDCFKVGRASLMASLEDALRYADLVKIEDVDQVLFDFDLVSKPAMTMMRDNAAIRAEKEKEAIGFYLSRHPIADVRSRMGKELPILISLPKYKGRYVKFVCLVDRCRQYRTKNGDMMMFVIGSDETGKFDLVCMPNIYRQHADDLVKGNYLYVEGIVDKETSCLVKKLTRIEKE